MSEAKLRVYSELNELKDRILKLGNFVKTETFNKLEEESRLLLLEQLHIMNAYTCVLVRRLDAWKEIKEGENNE